MVSPALDTVMGSLRTARIWYQCVNGFPGLVERVRVQLVPTNPTSNQAATPCTVQGRETCSDSLIDLMPEEDIDIEARKVGEAQPRQQAGQGREGGTPPKKERSATGEEEDEEDEEVSAMVCEACRGGHYEDQVRWLIQGGMGPFILVCGARLRDGPVGRCVGKGISDRTMPLTRRPVFHAQCRLFCATSATRGGTCSVSSPK